MKELIISIILLIIVFLFASSTVITLKPFSIKCTDIYSGIGIFLMIIGIVCISTNSYRKGIRKGVDDTINVVEEIINKDIKMKENLTFGQAIEALKEGKKVTRKGWNGKGMFLWLKPAVEIKAEWCKDELLKQLAENNGGSILGLGTICMYTIDSSGRNAILTGWLASQSDILACDWEIID